MLRPLLTFLVFVSVLSVFGMIYGSILSRKREHRYRLARRLGLETDFNRTPVFQTQRSSGALPWLQTLMQRAGDTRTSRQVLVQSLLLGLAGFLFSSWLFSGWMKLIGWLALGLPLLLLQQQAHARSRLLTYQLPDALDRMGRALRAGQVFADALRSTGEEMPAPIGPELSRASEQYRLGIDIRECLEDLALRTPDNFTLRLFVSAVLLHREIGGNLIEILERLAETGRERQLFEQRVYAMTAESRISAIILGSMPIFIAAILTLLRPSYLIPLISTDLGQMMLRIGLLMLLMGILVMRRLATVEV